MELSVGLPAAAAAAAAAADPPPFSGPDTPSARSMLSRRISCGSGGSSSWAPRILRPDKQKEEIGQWHDKVKVTPQWLFIFLNQCIIQEVVLSFFSGIQNTIFVHAIKVFTLDQQHNIGPYWRLMFWRSVKAIDVWNDMMTSKFLHFWLNYHFRHMITY